MRTVFVTGASSAMGQRIVAKLCRDHRILALVHRAPLSVEGENIIPVTGDLLDPSSYAASVSQADVILHMAGLTHSQHYGAYEKVNHEGTSLLLSTCRKDQRFIYISSRCIGASGGAYSHSKEKAEQAVMAHGLRYTIIRPSEIYGSKGGEGIDALIQLALKYRVVVDFRWDGSVTYSPVSVDEFSGLMDRVVRRDIRGKAVYTVCNRAVYHAESIRAALEESLQRRVFRLPVPVRLLMNLQRFRFPLPFKRDQLARLVMSKSNNVHLVCEDYNFAPEDFLTFIKSQGSDLRGRRVA
jgi:NADH dehydrogenase